jgi:hypothetical protein
MTTKTKTFDCVEMKNRIQAEIQAEYEAHRNEFPSFVEFVRAAAADSEYARVMHGKFGGGTKPAPTPPPR